MFQFKQFTIQQDRSSMKVTTDACLFGAWVADKIKASRAPGETRILDIGSGTGLLSLMVAQQSPLAVIDAIEMETGAARQSADNFRASPWADRLHAVQGDVRKYPFTRRYDIIISNPPFYEKEWPSGDAGKNMAHHDSGLLLAELVEAIGQNLSPAGCFFLLLPYKRKEEIYGILSQAAFHVTSLMLVRQTSPHSYSRIMLEGRPGEGGKNEKILFDEMHIRNDKNEYGARFISLLKDYYLYL